MDEALIRLDARLGVLEILVRNLYAHHFTGQPDPLEAAEQSMRKIEEMARHIEVSGQEPVVNDLLAAEAEEFLLAMFHEIVEIVRETSDLRSTPDSERLRLRISNLENSTCPPFPHPWPKLHRTG